jgi:hypothetical protein
MRPLHVVFLRLLVLPTLLGLFATTAYADGLGRLRMTLEIHGATDWRGGGTSGEWKTSKIDDSYWTEVVLKLGSPMNTNQWDPESAKHQQERNAQIQQRSVELQAQAARAAGNRPGGSNRPAGGMGNMDMAQMMAMRDKLQACGTDNACKQKIAMEMMAGGGTPAPAASAAAAAGASNGELVEAVGDDPDNDRYLPYFSHVDSFSCTFRGHGKVQHSFEGAEADVSGMLKLSGTEVGEGDADPKQICNYPLFIVDTKNNSIWGAGAAWIDVPVTSTQKGGLMNGHTATESFGLLTGMAFEATAGGQHFEGVGEWVAKTLAGAPLKGERTLDFTPTRAPSISAGGRSTGKLTAKLTWAFTKE